MHGQGLAAACFGFVTDQNNDGDVVLGVLFGFIFLCADGCFLTKLFPHNYSYGSIRHVLQYVIQLYTPSRVRVTSARIIRRRTLVIVLLSSCDTMSIVLTQLQLHRRNRRHDGNEAPI